MGGRKAKDFFPCFLFLYFNSTPPPTTTPQLNLRDCWRRRRGRLEVCVPVKSLSLSLRGSWPEEADLPQVALHMEITSNIEHRTVFKAVSSQKEEFLFTAFWLLAEMVFWLVCPLCTKP